MEHYPRDIRESSVPSRKSSLGAKSTAPQEHVRRKSSRTNELPSTSLSFDAVTISATNSPQTFTFFPVSTVLRAHIPLSWLAGPSPQCPPPGSLLRASIASISRWDYSVLVAKLTSGRTLFALEKVDVDVYVCYPLQSWVTSQWVEQASFGAAPSVDLAFLQKPSNDHSHSRKPSSTSITGAVDLFAVPPSPKIPNNRRGQLARLSILESRERTEEPSSIIDGENHHMLHESGTQDNLIESAQETAGIIADAEHSTLPLSDIRSQSVIPLVTDSNDTSSTLLAEETATSVDHLSSEHLRRQYLETLYVSKTSLAYYAKGPLSRARARARAPRATRLPTELADFYRESILSSKKLDLKYKESVENKITSLSTCEDGDADGNQRSTKKTRRTKLGKDGIWPCEEEYIKKWWKAQEVVPGLSRSFKAQATELRRSISHLRMRETEMQIVLMLEVLALEVRDIPKQLSERKTDISSVKIDPDEKQEPDLLSQTKTVKKKRDLKSELDFLVDRLCIWHSVGLDDLTGTSDTLRDSNASSERTKDRLRDFCKDVIVPFYAGKLPDECQSICTKMGGPEVSPQRSRIGKEREINQQIPGSVIFPPRPSNKRNMERVFSDEHSIRHASPPTLLRSATVPAQVTIKREPSERPINRSGMQKSVSFTNREVDLVADARATAAKRRKLDLVSAQKRELDAAIETLKRPNRSIVAKNFMDDVERRTNESRSSARKVEPVQISATPRRNRTRPYEMDDYDLPPISIATMPQEDSVVPSSASKPRGLSQVPSISRSSAKKRAVLSAIHDTPFRGTLHKTKQLQVDEGRIVAESKAIDGASSSTLIASTPTTSRLRIDLAGQIAVTPMRMTKSLKPVLITPMERSEADIDQMFRDAPEIPERAGKTMDRVMGSKSDAAGIPLYESLGWNDDYDL